MSETINTYLLNDPDTLIPMDRDEFYKEQVSTFKKEGKPTRANEIVQVFIFNTKGEMLVQKRSMEKNHNPGLIDKSLGGHVAFGDRIDYTVMVETVQELQTPSIVLKTEEDFKKTHTLLNNYLETIAIIKHIDGGIVMAPKKMKEETITIANKMHVYLGVYNGRIKPADGEAQGVLWYTIKNLEHEMKNIPDLFTQDMHILMDKYGDEFKKFADVVKKDG